MAPEPQRRQVLSYAGSAVARRAPLWWRLALTLACIYLPYAWLITDGYPWRDYRLAWIKMWPVLPGILAGLAVLPHTAYAGQLAAMGAMTAVGAALFLLLAARSRRWVPVATLLALVLSVANSWFAYAVYRA